MIWAAIFFCAASTAAQSGRQAISLAAVEPDSYEVTFTEDRAEFIRVDGAPDHDTRDHRLARRTMPRCAAWPSPTPVAASSTSKLPPTARWCSRRLRPMPHTRRSQSYSCRPSTWRRRARSWPHAAAVRHTTRKCGRRTTRWWRARSIGQAQIETDRVRFLGRGRGVRAPIAVIDGRRLSGTVGTVLDPVFALRHRLRIRAGATAPHRLLDAGRATRAGVLDLVDKHHDGNAYVRAATLAWTQAQVQLRHLGIDADEAALFQRLAASAVRKLLDLRPAVGHHPPRRRRRRGALGPRHLG